MWTIIPSLDIPRCKASPSPSPNPVSRPTETRPRLDHVRRQADRVSRLPDHPGQHRGLAGRASSLRSLLQLLQPQCLDRRVLGPSGVCGGRPGLNPDGPALPGGRRHPAAQARQARSTAWAGSATRSPRRPSGSPPPRGTTGWSWGWPSPSRCAPTRSSACRCWPACTCRARASPSCVDLAAEMLGEILQLVPRSSDRADRRRGLRGATACWGTWTRGSSTWGGCAATRRSTTRSRRRQSRASAAASRRRDRDCPARARRRGRADRNRDGQGPWVWRDIEVTVYGVTRMLRVLAYQAVWPEVLGLRPIQIVVVRDPAGKFRDAYLFTTDLGASCRGW